MAFLIGRIDIVEMFAHNVCSATVRQGALGEFALMLHCLVQFIADVNLAVCTVLKQLMQCAAETSRGL